MVAPLVHIYCNFPAQHPAALEKTPRMTLARLLVCVLPVLAGSLLSACSDERSAPAQQQASVGAVTVTTQSYDLQRTLPGRTVATMTSDVRPQIDGIIQERLFVEGDDVKAGQPLYRIDARPYEAAYDSAKADLAQAEAAVMSARPKAERYENLARIDAISRQDGDDAKATLREAEAAVLAAKAAVTSAGINLDYTRIAAPISGRIGTSAYTPGALVTAGQSTALTTIQQLDPIYVDVVQSSSQLLEMRREVASGRLKSVDGKVPVTILLEDGSDYPQKGTLAFVGTAVDTGTGNVTLRAVVPNPDRMLLPGMYVRAELPVAVDDAAILIPQSAVSRNTKGEATVKLVGADDKIVEKTIQTSEASGSQWIVTGGLQAGDRLVVDGGSRVRSGQPVSVQMMDAPASAAGQAAATPSATPGTTHSAQGGSDARDSSQH